MANSKVHPIYALPAPIPSYPPFKTHDKRKRRQSTYREDEEDNGPTSNTEYSAVISPDERAQRRLAGQRIDCPPPPTPFPHASHSRVPGVSESNPTHGSDHLVPLDTTVSSSLRNHHVAVMLAILHQSLERNDYVRAAGVIGVLLRTEILGKTVDIRHSGLWNISAEILARESGRTTANRISTTGFQKAKVLYDKLALQYPWHRSWPNVINAQDFKIAMFDLWIYVVCIESKRVEQQYIDHDDSLTIPQSELRSKRWELGEADAMSKEIDLLLGTVPFVDHLELIRLRAMIALWIANLVDTVDLLATDIESNNSFQQAVPQEHWPNDVGNHPDSSVRKSNEKAEAARSLAKVLFTKLGMDDKDDMIVDDETDVDTGMFPLANPASSPFH